jgi:tripartite ATP-independent transporter DctP family solute receptor
MLLITTTLSGCLGSTVSSSGAAAAASSGPQTAPTAVDGTMNTGSIKPTANTRVVQLGHCNPGTDQDHYTYFGRQFNDYLMTLSDGKFGIEVMADSQLGAERDLFEGCTMGTVDIAIVTNLIFTSSIPESNMLEMPFLYDNEEQGYATFNHPEIKPMIQKIFYDDWSIYAPVYIEGGFRKTMVAKKPVNGIEDFKGMKLRVPESPLYLKTFQSIGANPTTMAYNEVFTALQQGVVDGLEIPVASIYSSKYHELCDYMVETDHIYTAAAVCFSRAFWDKLSAEEQGWFEQAAVKAADDEVRFVREGEARKVQEMKDFGCTVVSLPDKTPFRDAVKPLYEEYKGVVGEEFYNKIMSILGR